MIRFQRSSKLAKQRLAGSENCLAFASTIFRSSLICSAVTILNVKRSEMLLSAFAPGCKWRCTRKNDKRVETALPVRYLQYLLTSQQAFKALLHLVPRNSPGLSENGGLRRSAALRSPPFSLDS